MSIVVANPMRSSSWTPLEEPLGSLPPTPSPSAAAAAAPPQAPPPSLFSPPSGVYLGPLPLLQPPSAADEEERARRRRELMLDDDVLSIAWVEPRRHVPARVAAFHALSLLTGGTLAVVSQWAGCRRRAITSTSAFCAPGEADFVLVGGADGTFEACEVEPVAVRALENMGLSEGAARRREARGGAARGPISTSAPRRMFMYRHTRYLLREGGAGPAGGAPAGSVAVPAPGAPTFCEVRADDFPPPAGDVLAGGLTEAEAAARLALLGPNLIDVPIPPWSVLLLKECVHPFVMFQVWAVIVWLTEAYYSFSMFILATALATALTNLWDLLKNLRDIRRISLFSEAVRVLRVGGPPGGAVVPSETLVPGDVVALRAPAKVPADMVLLRGSASVVEAMLTGEATVVTKTRAAVAPAGEGALAEALARAPFRATLFGGTNLVAARGQGGEGDALAVVVRTGFHGVKGRLVLSILYPLPSTFKFMQQSLRFIGLLFAMAMVGFAVNAKALADFGTGAAKIVQRGADMVTIVVPPALPLAITVGTMYAIVALRRRGVGCIAPSKVNVAGKVNAFCFDKTGTLTEEGLQFAALRPAEGGAFLSEVDARGGGGEGGLLARVGAPLAWLLGTCHALTLLEGKPVGDPLEEEVFRALAGATLTEGEEGGAAGGAAAVATVALPGLGEGTVVHKFEFTAAKARMGTLVRRGARGGGAALCSFVKGAPEAIKELCDPATLPPDFEEVLAHYVRQGLRVLAGGWKPYPHAPPAGEGEEPAARDAAEAGLAFLGLIVLENRLKAASAPTIARLTRETGMPLVMVTGDNPVAAVAIARQCGLLPPEGRVFLGDLAAPAGAPPPGAAAASAAAASAAAVQWADVDAPAGRGASALAPDTLLPHDGSGGAPYRLALTGRAFTALREGVAGGTVPAPLLLRALLNCAVAARMAPEAKAAFVGELQAAGLYVGMVGDGANDTSALKAADVGISLSAVEASVAAPFTYAAGTIEAVPLVLAEGRGALATSFCLFQFMALYSTIQFANALCVVFSNSFLSNNM
jgi:cation-transporting ATPase 13A2